jgi:hypothetical protein
MAKKSFLGSLGPAATRKLAQLAKTRRQFTFIRNENRKSLLDRKPNSTTQANELLLVAGECGFAFRIERTAELCEEGIVHVHYSP